MQRISNRPLFKEFATSANLAFWECLCASASSGALVSSWFSSTKTLWLHTQGQDQLGHARILSTPRRSVNSRGAASEEQNHSTKTWNTMKYVTRVNDIDKVKPSTNCIKCFLNPDSVFFGTFLVTVQPCNFPTWKNRLTDWHFSCSLNLCAIYLGANSNELNNDSVI